jgi:hypothetical protein
MSKHLLLPVMLIAVAGRLRSQTRLTFGGQVPRLSTCKPRPATHPEGSGVAPATGAEGTRGMKQRRDPPGSEWVAPLSNDAQIRADHR